MKYKYLMFFLLFIIIACNKNNEDSNVLLFVEPKDGYLEVNPNSKIDFQFTCSSNKELSKFTITQKLNNYELSTLFDTSIAGQKYQDSYEFIVPICATQNEIVLVFKAENVEYENIEVAKVLQVIYEDSLLLETTGHVMYSHLSNKADGYNLILGTPVFTSYEAEKNIHIYDASIDTINFNYLSKRWETFDNVKFVSFNEFDYANATKQSIKNAYNSGIKKGFVDNIQDDEIIISNIRDSVLVAIKIVAVVDSDSTFSDRYIFNIKK